MTYLYVILFFFFDNNDSESDVINYKKNVLNVFKNFNDTCDTAKNCYRTYKMLCAAVIRLKFDNVYGSCKNKKIRKTNFIKEDLTRYREETNIPNLE